MAKKLKSQLFVHGPNADFGTVVPVDVKSTDGVTKVKLSDGGELEIKVLVFDVKRSLNRHNPDGNPVYAVHAAQVIKATVPPRLKVKAPTARAKTVTQKRRKT